jgi:hypothetical protein
MHISIYLHRKQKFESLLCEITHFLKFSGYYSVFTEFSSKILVLSLGVMTLLYDWLVVLDIMFALYIE